ncbi:SusC/RagA family TonB-linked outer membrane protein [Arcticibacter tournemirensis]
MTKQLFIKFRKRLFLSLLYLVVSMAAYAQTKQIRGTVVDEKNEPLPGATVKAKSGKGSASTGADGKFTVTVPQNEQTLTASFIGFDLREVSIAGQTNITIKMVPSSKSLEEVVVIGYGTQRREAVTGSVASISGDKMRDVPSTGITQALQGRLPGVELAQTSTQPGAAMRIRVRGTRSLTASNDPLIVLDGIPFTGSINDINPNDIQSLDILKDASATAIYGSRGANGVILVTTTKGRKDQKATLSYNGYVGAKDVFSRYPMMSGQELADLRVAANYSPKLGADEADGVNTDWQDLLYQTGMVNSHDIGIVGGTSHGSYNFGLGYYKDQGVIPTQQYDRITLRASIDQEIGKYFRMGFTSNNNYNLTQGSNVGMYGILSMSPLASPYNQDGTWRRVIHMPQDDQWVYSKEIVDSLEDQWLSQTRGYATYNALYGEFKIPGIEGLKYRANVGLDFRQSNGGDFTGKGVNSVNATTPSTASVSNANTYHWAVENLLTYDRTFKEKHRVNVVGLYSLEQNKYNRSRMSAKDIPFEDFQFYNLGQAAGEITIAPGDQQYELTGLMSWMGRVMYSYNDRYMLSATLRSDGSSRLAPGFKWHTYPAVSAGWNIGNEPFMKNISAINSLKLRVGFGQTSNQAVAPYSTLGTLSTRPYNFGSAYSTGFYVSRLPNPALGWEYSKTWNYGVDFALLNNRLSGTVEYYITNTEDLLLDKNLPPTAGVTKFTGNIGKTQNKGIEISLNGQILSDANGWNWEAGVNFYANQNKITGLASGLTRDENNWWFVGHPINVIFDWEKTGLWQEGEPVTDYESGGTAGMIKVKYTGDYDANGKPVRKIGTADRQILDADPDFQGGFNTRLAYKGFDLSAVAVFQSGGILLSSLYGTAGYLNMMSGRRGNVKVDYWTPENPDAKYPNPAGPRTGDNPKYGSTLGYFDASYLKMRTISLGYNFNQKWVKKAGINRFRVYGTVQNPFVLFSPYYKESGMDPETNSAGDQNTAVANAFNSRMLIIGTNAPSTRNYLFGVNVTF